MSSCPAKPDTKGSERYPHDLIQPGSTGWPQDFLKTGAAAFTTSIFTGNLKGANDRVNVAFIGVGRMGSGTSVSPPRCPALRSVAVCDVYQPALERAEAQARRLGFTGVKAVKDFREILADKSIDAVCISAPDHWHAYMTVEACKAGKDVYVEKPACVYVEEGVKMVEAARKYKRVVQGGTMQRSGEFFQKAREIVKSGDLGDITFCRTFQAGLTQEGGLRQSAGFAIRPPGLDWDMWLGPAPKRPFNAEPLGRGGRALVHLPLLLGLRRRRHDRLGRAPARYRAVRLRRSHAGIGGGAGRQVLRRRQHRNARHACW